MKRLGIALLALLLTGCAFGAYQTWADFRNRNSAALANLRIGMTPEQVKEIMGTASVTECSMTQGVVCLATETATNPGYTSAVMGADGKSYMAWMYYTSYCAGGLRSLACYTPIVFQDGRVVGWGAEYLSGTKLDLNIH